MRWAALLRAANVGGRKLASANLKRFAEELGLGEVKTLLASGNLLFDTPEERAATLEHMLERASEAAFGFRAEFLLRHAGDLDTLIAANPFQEQARDRPSQLLVHFFQRSAPPPAWVAAITADKVGPEALATAGRELLIDYADGIGRSTLGPLMAKARYRALAGDTGVNTARNWNTVLKLREALG